jgi:hypothetical protein
MLHIEVNSKEKAAFLKSSLPDQSGNSSIAEYGTLEL